ncbi:MAG: methyltransferase domain-containing protein [bacterium]
MLDIGGGGKLIYFIKGVKLTTTNLDSGDIKCDGRKLPFKKNDFDVVVSLDVLEHVPNIDRSIFISEMMRVAKKTVVFCAALGTPEHEAHARHMSKMYREKSGHPNKHLEEHLALGMPLLKEMKDILSNERYSMRFENILGMAQRSRSFRCFQPENKLLGKVLLVFQLLFTMAQTFYMELFIYDKSLSDKPTTKTNRFYVRIDKEENDERA